MRRLFALLLGSAIIAGCAAGNPPAPGGQSAATGDIGAPATPSAATPSVPPTSLPSPEPASAPPSPATSPVTSGPAPSTRPAASPAPGIEYSDPVSYRVTYRLDARRTSFKVDRLLVYQALPVAWDAQRDVRVEKVTPGAAARRTDRATGSGMLTWDLGRSRFKAASVDLLLRFRLTAYETRMHLAPADVKPYRTSAAEFERYTGAERFIESADRAIVAEARRVAGSETNPLVLARRFYDDVIGLATYDKTGTGLHGAKQLLATGKGECGDYAALFVALSRASGIPSRPVVGYWAESGIDQTHVWAEFYLEGFGWVPVDPTLGQSDAARRDDHFGSLDNRRIVLGKGFNIRLSPAAPDRFVAPFLQVPSWWFWGTGSGTVTVDRAAWTVERLP
jgi:transglutaminase-like putative cysteine protease